ncbi:MAG TPA: thiamine-phosphate kinase [Blastocatellia bacterium]|nr:thiamine-phosphate kinase [Blastocatellia bacterium]
MTSESQIIDWIRKRAAGGPRVRVGIGDDAAVLEVAGNRDLIACCDLVVEGVHFRTDWSPPSCIGYKALAAAVSDVAAMGGLAKFALMSFAVPSGLPEAFLTELLDGMRNAADEYEVTLVGGDTSASPSGLFIDVTILGECSRGMAVTRSGAKPGDLVLVSGSLGAAELGLELLKSGLRIESAVSELQMEAIGKHLQPEPRVALGRAIGELGLATAMIDISDGLSTDITHLLDESGCGATLRARDIPVAECATALAPGLGLDPLALALNGGEEYELLFAVKPETVDRINELAGSLGETVSVIGEMRSERGLVVERDGAIESLGPGGFEHRL